MMALAAKRFDRTAVTNKDDHFLGPLRNRDAMFLICAAA
jgi:hypothetical protein